MANHYASPGVYVQEVDRGSKPIEGVGTAVAAFVGFTKTFPDDPSDPLGVKPRLVTNWAQFERQYGGFVKGAMLPHAVYGFFDNGGGAAYIVRVPTQGQDSRPRQSLFSAARPDLETMQVEALEPGARVEIVIETPAPPGEAGEGEAPSSFNMKVRRDGQEVESFSDLSLGGRGRTAESVVNSQSTQVRVKVATAGGVPQAERLPQAGTFPLEQPPPAPAQVTGRDFEGTESERTGIRGLAIADEVTMVACPDLGTATTRDGQVDLDMYQAVQAAMIGHCESVKSRMALLDAPPGMTPQEVKEWRERMNYDAMFAALYYPNLIIDNPLVEPGGNGTKRLSVPPSGHVAGVWARSDAARGVWKAPANEIVRGALALETEITRGEQDQLNPIGVNCIRAFGVNGLRVWGARTLSSNPSWRYINVRRLFNYVEQSIERGTQWVVFEPNDVDLWQQVKRTLYAFLNGLWRQGALTGATPEQAFYIKCDEETNPPDQVDKGRLLVEIGIAPVKPAEFVIFQISQWQSGSAE
jgi:phage tail sheath protein FI